MGSEMRLTVSEVARGLGVASDRVQDMLRTYFKPLKAGEPWILTASHVWECIDVVGINQGGLWSGLSREELEHLIGARPDLRSDGLSGGGAKPTDA